MPRSLAAWLGLAMCLALAGCRGGLGNLFDVY